MRPAFTISGQPGRFVATALHAGHELRPEVAARIAIDDATRLREEDPGTDELTGVAPAQIVAHRSRFEVDLNRPRHEAVYLHPEDAWGLEVWQRTLSRDVVARSREIYDDFYGSVAKCFDELACDGPFLVLDVHSYNHRRNHDRTPGARALMPEVNVGTGTLDRARWASVLERFLDELGGRIVREHRLDVRENVRFRGGHFAEWTHGRYPDTGVVLAVELKKLFMDEWTGAIDVEHLGQLRGALGAAGARAVETMVEHGP
jgi:N-formylglutamate amidohydrolase